MQHSISTKVSISVRNDASHSLWIHANEIHLSGYACILGKDKEESCWGPKREDEKLLSTLYHHVLVQFSSEAILLEKATPLFKIFVCAQCEILLKIWPFLLRFSRRNWRVIFEVFQSNFGFGWLNTTVRCLVWENEQKNWEIFTSSLRSHIFQKWLFCGDFPNTVQFSVFSEILG